MAPASRIPAPVSFRACFAPPAAMADTPSVNGACETTAAMAGSLAATAITWPPLNDEPQTATRRASTPGRLRACATAACQSASWREMLSSWRGSPWLAPKWR